jgi:adenine deaminase
MAYYRGRLAAEDGKPLFTSPGPRSSGICSTVNVKPFIIDALSIPAEGEESLVIEAVPGQIVTRKRREKVTVVNGTVVPDTSRDILKLAVVERHKATGNIGRGLVTGFGLKRGALASSVSHDSHNIVAVGTSDEDILASVKEIERMQGGLAAAADGKILAILALPVAGLLAVEPLETVVAKVEKLEKIAVDLGAKLPSPFAALSFLALPVIPELRLTDLGMVDVNEFKLVE